MSLSVQQKKVHLLNISKIKRGRRRHPSLSLLVLLRDGREGREDPVAIRMRAITRRRA